MLYYVQFAQLKGARHHAFEFSKLLSFIFLQLKNFFHKLNIEEGDLQHLSIEDILSFIQKEIDIPEIKQKIDRNRKLKGVASTIRLPELIRSTDDFYVIPHIASKPNFFFGMMMKCN